MSHQQQIDTLLVDALRCYDQGETEDARRICREVLAIDPNESAALHHSGLIANDQGDSRGAAQLLEHAVRANPDDPDTWNDFGNALQLCGQIHDAMAAFGQAMRLAPSFAAAHSNYGSEQLPPARERFSIIDLGMELDRAGGAFIDTEAVIQNLDLVICSDTALVHLAGTLGVPVWVPTSFIPDWRWLLDRSDSPWYPTVQLFRQRERLNWDSVFDELSGELKARL